MDLQKLSLVLQRVAGDLPESAQQFGKASIDQLQQVVNNLPGKATKTLRLAIDKVKDELEKLEKRKRFQQPTAGFDKLFK